MPSAQAPGEDVCPDGLAAIDAPWGVRAGHVPCSERQYRDRRWLRWLVHSNQEVT
jgi:hypothetical protein